MVSALASSAVDRVFESRSVQTKDHQIIDMCCFFAKHATLRNVSEWGDRSICEQLFQWTPSPFHWKLTCSSHHILQRLVQEVVANPLPCDHDTLPFYHIICMLYPKTEGMIFFSERYCRHLKKLCHLMIQDCLFYKIFPFSYHIVLLINCV